MPNSEEQSRRRKSSAAEANNRAWSLAEQTTRTAAETEEMVHAAHAAMYFWQIEGTANQIAHAQLLLAHVHALVGQALTAKHYEQAAESYFQTATLEPWEAPLVKMIAANVAYCQQDFARHAAQHAEATRLIAALPTAQDREILEATLRIIPQPNA